MAPIQLRVGGAFIATAVVLFIFAFLSIMRGEAVFDITSRFVMIVAASVIFGAFATSDTSQPGSRKQLIALGIAVALLAIGMLLPNTVLTVAPTMWLVLWGVGALLCALILRRFSR